MHDQAHPAYLSDVLGARRPPCLAVGPMLPPDDRHPTRFRACLRPAGHAGDHSDYQPGTEWPRERQNVPGYL